jgi:hypothetical protein
MEKKAIQLYKISAKTSSADSNLPVICAPSLLVSSHHYSAHAAGGVPGRV